MDTNAYVTFLLVGVLLVVVDGQIIYRSGRRYLEGSYGDPAAGASMTRLVTVFFHLAVLGLLALLSTIDLGGGSTLPAVVGKLGVMLLVLAIAHGITIAVLSRIRDEQVGESFAARRVMANEPPRRDAVVSSPPEQAGAGPIVSPSLDYQAPYSTPER
jgi:hypothetical protein